MKRILKISGISLAVIAAATLLATGILLLIRNNNTVKTGNVLGVSWYNETDKEFTIKTAKQLQEFAELSHFYTFEGQTIKLGADIVLNEGNAEEWKEKAPANRWKPIEQFAGTFNGQGHSISGLYGKSYSAPMALFVHMDKDGTIQNVKLLNSYFTTGGRAGTASFVAVGGGKLKKLYSDAIIQHNGDMASGIFSKVSETTTIEECWFAGSIDINLSMAGGIVDYIKDARVAIKHSLFSGTINSTFVPYDSGNTGIGGMCGYVTGRASVTVQDSLSSGIINAEVQTGTGSMVGYVRYGGDSKATFLDTFASEKTAVASLGASTGVITGGTIISREKELLGVKGYQWTTLNFDRYWAAVENDTPVLKCFAENPLSLEGVEKEYDMSWYNANEYVYELKDLKDLYGFAFLSVGNNFAEKRIKLGADIVVNEGTIKDWEKEAPAYPWYPIGNFYGTFDGQGHTVSGIYLKNSIQYQGFFTQVQQSGVIKDFNLKNSYFCSTNETLSMIGSIAGEFRGVMDKVYSNATVVGYGPQIGGLIARANDSDSTGNKKDTITMKNCWFDGEVFAKGKTTTYAGGLVSALIQGDLEILHCLNTGTIHSECEKRAIHVGGLVGSVSHVEARLVIKDSLNTGKIDAVYDVGVGSAIGRIGSKQHTATIENTYTTADSHLMAIGTSGGTFHGGVIRLDRELLSGNNAYKFTMLDFDKNWALVKNGTPMLQAFTSNIPSTKGIQKMIDVSWYKPDGKTFTIKNLKQLYGFAELASAYDFEGQTVKLGANITVNTPNVAAWKADGAAPSNPWIVIGTMSKPFRGTFDGAGHTVSGIYLKTDTQYVGMFGYAYTKSAIKNLRLTDSYFCNTNKELSMVGSIAGEARGVIEGVYSNAVVVGYGPQVAGIVARANDNDDDKVKDTITISNCWFDGEVYGKGKTHTYTAGIVSCLIQGDLEVLHCLNTGTIYSEGKGRAIHTAGLVGSVSHKEARLVMKDSFNSGAIKASYDVGVGSVIGRLSSKQHSATLRNVYATIESQENAVGTSSGTLDGGGIQLITELLTGANAFKFAELDYKNYWAIVDGGTPVLKKFAGNGMSTAGLEKMVDTSWYDPKADVLTIHNLKQLYGLASLSSATDFAGQTIRLAADITVNTPNVAAWEAGTEVPSNPWITIGSYAKKFAGTFDGQNHTISGIYLETDMWYAGVFGVVAPSGLVKNLRIEDSYFNSTSQEHSMMASVVGELRGSIENVYSNAVVVGTGNQIGGLVSRAMDDGNKDATKNKVVTIKNCWFDGKVSIKGVDKTQVGGILGAAIRGAVVVEHCMNSGTISSEAQKSAIHAGGLIGSVSNQKANVQLTDSLNTGLIQAAYDVGVGSAVGRVGSTSAKPEDHTITIRNTYSTNEGVAGNGTLSTVGTSSGVFADDLGVIQIDTELLLGKEAYRFADLDFAKYWATSTEGVPQLKYFAEKDLGTSGIKKMVDTKWYFKGDYKLDTVEELYGFALLSSATDFEGKTVELTEDIVVNTPNVAAWKEGTETPENPWICIGVPGVKFAGTFDGNDKTISGLYMNTDETYVGMFGSVDSEGVVKDFCLKDSYLCNTNTVGNLMGAIVGELRGTLSGVYSNATVEGYGKEVGGLVGRAMDDGNAETADEITIENCWFDGEVLMPSQTARYGGGILGSAFRGPINIAHCLSSGKIVSACSNSPAVMGGIVAGMADIAATLKLTDSLSIGTISVARNDCVGSVIGQIGTSGAADKTYAVKFTDVYAATETHKSVIGYSYPTTMTMEGSVWELVKELYLDDNVFKYTKLDFTNYWVGRKENFAALDKFVPESEKLEYSILDKADTSWYDDHKEDDEYYIGTEEQLYGLVLLAQKMDFEGKTIHLTEDMNLNQVNETILEDWKDGKTAKNPWTPIGTSKVPFAGTFDGNGHTISGLYINKTAWGYYGLFGSTTGKAVIKNFKLVDSYMATTDGYLGVVGYGTVEKMENIYSNTTIKNVKGFASAGMLGALVPASESTLATFTNCWFDGSITSGGDIAAGIVGNITARATIEFNNCLNSGSISCTKRAGGILGYINNGWNGSANKWRFNNCLSVGDVETTGTDTWSVAGALVAGINTNANSMTVNHSYGVADKLVGKNSSGTVPSGYLMSRDEICIMDVATLFPGSDAWVNDNENGWDDTNRGTPILATFADFWRGRQPAFTPVVDLSWYNNNPGPNYELNSLAAVRGFAAIANTKDDFTGKTVTLNLPNKELKLNEVSESILASWKGSTVPDFVWTPIGTSAKPFKGTFDGNGHTISGLYINKTAWGYYGMFGYVTGGAVIKNFQLVDSYMATTDGYLGVVGYGTVEKMENIYSNTTIKNVKGFASAGMLGALVPASESTLATFTNCWFDGSITSGGDIAAGIVGNITARATIEFNNCLNSGSISCTKRAGGILGYINNGWNGSANKWRFNNCLSVGDVETTGTDTWSVAGALVAGINTNANSMTVNHSYGVADKLVGKNYSGTVPSGYLKTKQELIDTDVTVLFPTSSAWKNVTGKTPILNGFGK